MPNIPLPPRNADGSYTTAPAGMAIDADGANGQTGGVPYIVLPGHWRKEAVGVVLGCKATVEDTMTGRILEAAGVLDFGPRAKLGEASIACAKFFGIPSSPKDGGTSEKRFIFFPGIPAVINGVKYQLQPAS